MNATLITVCTDKPLNFKGNTAAVILLDNPLPTNEMQRIAKELNQPATTFLWAAIDEKNVYNVRWFAPDAEIGLCGHGSLAAFAYLEEGKGENAFVEKTILGDDKVNLKGKPVAVPSLEANRQEITLRYKNGEISGTAKGKFTEMQLAGIEVIQELPIPEQLKQGLGIDILNYYETENKNIVLVKNETDVAEMQPDFAKLRVLETFGYTVTAQGDAVDFVSRTLVPHVQQLEDHATGSSHAALTPFWNKRLGKTEMIAHQLSPNGGKFWCEMLGNMVSLNAEYVVRKVVEIA